MPDTLELCDVPRTCCAKCGAALRHPNNRPRGPQAYCKICRWLLQIGAAADRSTVTLDEIDATGYVSNYHKQFDEPIPFVPLRVELWPELFFPKKPRYRRPPEARAAYFRRTGDDDV